MPTDPIVERLNLVERENKDLKEKLKRIEGEKMELELHVADVVDDALRQAEDPGHERPRRAELSRAAPPPNACVETTLSRLVVSGRGAGLEDRPLVGQLLADVAAEAEAVLRLLGHIVHDRSHAEWRVLDLLTPGVRGQQKAVAEELGITTQAVSKAVARSQWNEEHAARPAAARLLGLILEVR